MKCTLTSSAIAVVSTIAVSFFIAACSRNTPVTENGSNITPISVVHSIDSTVFGTWYWTQSRGGIAGATITPSTAGYTQKLILRRDSSYASYRADTLLGTAKFTTRRELRPGSNDSVCLIFFRGQPTQIIRQSIALEGADTLHLDDYNIMDGFNNTYVRIGFPE